ncbi:MAG: hypothetical protein U0797_03575 [Gemmataceae bacterium]
MRGVGIWGVNAPVGWGFAIVNFVWWIGIGHAGTLISAILLLLHQPLADGDQPLRRGDDAVRRRLRAMFPLFHMGRPWFFYWLMPYPSTMELGRSAARWSGTSSPSAPTPRCRCCSGSSA